MDYFAQIGHNSIITQINALEFEASKLFSEEIHVLNQVRHYGFGGMAFSLDSDGVCQAKVS